MISFDGLSKHYGATVAVDNLSADVQAGTVTGFLGPNGAGKSSAIRILLGLSDPTAGTALINGRRYSEMRWPLREVGACLDGTSAHPHRSARAHLRALAASTQVGRTAVEDTLDRVGLSDVASHHVSTFSLGMTQRLELAAALIGDPATLVLDEPLTGLDPDGVRWLRDLLHTLADQGGTVLISSHLLSEMAITAHRLLVLDRGHLLAHTSLSEFLSRNAAPTVIAHSSDQPALSAALARAGAVVNLDINRALLITGITTTQVGEIALTCGIAIHELTTTHTDLETAYFAATGQLVDSPHARAVGQRGGAPQVTA